MQKFNTNNVETRFIKNILKNTYLPSIPTVKDGDYIVSGVEYCYKNSIIECETTGVLNDTSRYFLPYASDLCLCAPDFICGVGVRQASYRVLKTLEYETHLPGVNINYVSSSNIYDTSTHKQLGKYLRYYRDVKNIDLMPMYNCFCNESISTIHIKDNELKDGNDGHSNVWIVPAHLNKEYTLYINSSTNVSICGAFLNDYGRIKNVGENDGYLDELLDNEVLTYSSISYNNPVKYTMFTNNQKLLSYNNNFYIVIQTTTDNFVSIVAIEGPHKRHYNRIVTNVESHSDHIQEGRVNIDYDKFSPIVVPSMAQTPISYYTPYSPRLIEFLTGHAITNEEDIPNNIIRIQESLNKSGAKIANNDIWSDRFKYLTWNRYFKYYNRYYLDSSQVDAHHNPVNALNMPSDTQENLLAYDREGNLVGLKNCTLKRGFETVYDITGNVDKDVENAFFNYRGV